MADLRHLYNIEGDGPNRWILLHQPELPEVHSHWEAPEDRTFLDRWNAAHDDPGERQRAVEAIDLVHRIQMVGGCS